MNYQRLSQTRTAKTNPQPQEKTRANYTPHPLEELQRRIGNRAMGRLLQQQRQEAEASGKLPNDSLGPRSIESYGQPSMLRKPLFRGLSHEWTGKSQPQETPVQRTVIDGNANSSVEDKTDTPTQPPSRGIQKPLFRGLSHEWTGKSQPQETPVQRTVIDGNANSSVEDKTDTPTQPPSRGIQKPLFRGLSHEWTGKSQPQETPVQRTVIDGNANSSVEDQTDTPTQPPSRGIQKPLFRGLSHEWTGKSQPQETPVQTKLTLGKAGDKYEQEADAVAHQVVNQINSPTPSTANPEDKENQPNPLNTETLPSQNTPIAAKPNPPSLPTSLNSGETVSQPIEQGIQQARSGGVPLAEGIREPMEQAFGADFSGVRVHTDVQSDALNQSLSSRAFTTGEDIFFRQGEYNPGSRGGQELLAHELTHVVQQGTYADKGTQKSKTTTTQFSSVIQRSSWNFLNYLGERWSELWKWVVSLLPNNTGAGTAPSQNTPTTTSTLAPTTTSTLAPTTTSTQTPNPNTQSEDKNTLLQAWEKLKEEIEPLLDANNLSLIELLDIKKKTSYEPNINLNSSLITLNKNITELTNKNKVTSRFKKFNKSRNEISVKITELKKALVQDARQVVRQYHQDNNLFCTDLLKKLTQLSDKARIQEIKNLQQELADNSQTINTQDDWLKLVPVCQQYYQAHQQVETKKKDKWLKGLLSLNDTNLSTVIQSCGCNHILQILNHLSGADLEAKGNELLNYIFAKKKFLPTLFKKLKCEFVNKLFLEGKQDLKFLHALMAMEKASAEFNSTSSLYFCDKNLNNNYSHNRIILSKNYQHFTVHVLKQVQPDDLINRTNHVTFLPKDIDLNSALTSYIQPALDKWPDREKLVSVLNQSTVGVVYNERKDVDVNGIKIYLRLQAKRENGSNFTTLSIVQFFPDTSPKGLHFEVDEAKLLGELMRDFWKN